MFRRRTDHIYATLQQVQRRITQGTEPRSGGSQLGGASTASPGQGTAPAQTGSQAPDPLGEPLKPLPGSQAASATNPGTVGGGGYVVHPDGRREQTVEETRSDSSEIARQAAEVKSRGITTQREEPEVTFDDDFAEDPAPPAPVPASPAPAPAPAPTPSVGVLPRPQGQTGFGRRPEAPATASGGETSASPGTQAVAAADAGRGRGPGLRVSPELTSVVAVMWLATIAVAYLLGFNQGSGDEVDDTPPTVVRASQETGDASVLPVNVGDQRSDERWIVVINSVGRGNEAKQQPIYEKWKQRLNPHFARQGFHEYFGLRHLQQTGGLQFVYGATGNGEFGISKREAEAMHDELRREVVREDGQRVVPFPDAYLKKLD